ncbi:hypothetical protein ACOJIV_21750 [Haloarcula sp. AONF1]
MTERDTLIQIYTTEENQEWFEELADEAGTSVSEYGHGIIEDHVGRETGKRQYDRYGTDTELEVTLDSLEKELNDTLSQFKSETLEEVRYVQQVRTAYIIAIWRLIQDNYTPAERQLAMKFAEKFTGQDLNIEAGTMPVETDSSDADTEAAAHSTGDDA